MVKIIIKKRVKKIKPIKFKKNTSYIFKKRPIVINFIPPKKEEPKPKEERDKKGFGDSKFPGGFGSGDGKFPGGYFPPSIKLIPSEKKKYRIEGLPFPYIESDIKPIKIIFKKQDLRAISIKYPLIPNKPKRGEEIYAYTHIHWNENTNELIYQIVEPELNEANKQVLNILKDYVREKIDIDFAAIKKFEARNYIFKKIDDAIGYFKLDLPDSMVKIFRYYVYRDFLGFDMVEPLLQDENIEDISCDGVNIPLYIVHRDSRFGSIKTNIVFNSPEELDSFVMKLAQKCGRDLSVAHPLLDGILPDNSRVQATLATDIARKGSNFTIRRFSKEPFTPSKQILFHTCDVKLMAYLWFAMENGRSILISGGTGSGKTSFLNSISMLAKPEEKIVSIEDTGELQLPHPNWVPEVSRSELTVSGRGSVTLFDLLRESLRQRPDRIIVGEVRGKEAFVLFQAMATGHPGLATIHAESIDTLIDRLITEPINLPSTLLEILDIIVFISRVKIGGKVFRRVTAIEEIAGMNYKTERPIINNFAKWDPKSDEFKIADKSVVLKNIVDRTGIDKYEMEADILNKAKVLEWLSKNQISNYKQIGEYFAQYNADNAKFLENIGEVDERKISPKEREHRNRHKKSQHKKKHD